MSTPLNNLKISLPEKIADNLRHNIITGQIRKGEYLNEVSLADGYGVSRGSIRQAIMMLANEGLVQNLSNGRTIVLGFGVDEMRDYYHIRRFLECEAVKKIVTYPDDQAYKDFINRLSSFVFNDAGVPIHLRAARGNEMDMNFHRTIVDFAGSQILRQTWGTLSNINKTILALKATYLRNESSSAYALGLASHKKIVELLNSRDIDSLLKELNAHMEISVEIYKNVISEMEKDHALFQVN